MDTNPADHHGQSDDRPWTPNRAAAALYRQQWGWPVHASGDAVWLLLPMTMAAISIHLPDSRRAELRPLLDSIAGPIIDYASGRYVDPDPLHRAQRRAHRHRPARLGRGPSRSLQLDRSSAQHRCRDSRDLAACPHRRPAAPALRHDPGTGTEPAGRSVTRDLVRGPELAQLLRQPRIVRWGIGHPLTPV